MPRIPLDNDIKENLILDIASAFINQDIDVAEAQEIAAAAIETLKVSRGEAA